MLAKDKGHIKGVWGMTRYSRLASTTEVSMQSLEDGVCTTMNSIYDELSDTGAWDRDLWQCAGSTIEAKTKSRTLDRRFPLGELQQRKNGINWRSRCAE